MKKVYLVIGIIILIASFSIVANAQQQQGTVVMEGEDVIQTTDGKIYVGQGIAINGSWITLFHVRFPVLPDNKPVGAATFPAEKVKIVYHKGPIDMQGATTKPAEETEIISDKDAEEFNTW